MIDIALKPFTTTDQQFPGGARFSLAETLDGRFLTVTEAGERRLFETREAAEYWHWEAAQAGRRRGSLRLNRAGLSVTSWEPKSTLL